jgi:hypothetical protein
MYLLVKGEVSSMSPTLLQGLASVAAAGFELELLQLTCARCSSVGCSEEVFDSGSQTSHEPHRLLLSVLKCLGEACALHEVGKLLADNHAIVTPALPVEHLEVAEAVARCGDAELVLAWLTRMGSRGQWIVWLVDSLIEALCESALHGEEEIVLNVLARCESLGGAQFANAVCSAGSRSPSRAGMTPSQMASGRLKEVLTERYTSDILKRDAGFGDPASLGSDSKGSHQQLSDNVVDVAAISTDTNIAANIEELIPPKEQCPSLAERMQLWVGSLFTITI